IRGFSRPDDSRVTNRPPVDGQMDATSRGPNVSWPFHEPADVHRSGDVLDFQERRGEAPAKHGGDAVTEARRRWKHHRVLPVIAEREADIAPREGERHQHVAHVAPFRTRPLEELP